ncbi:Uncharacterised protein [Serratia marcescens]|uniref:hypothetical protein n=1 Tax=Serratia marcescens TaxID=615 RepID=UPI00217B34EE|nr:hypothetical protein [Serratia marcescens]CAI1583297.1 Uncharacterised protein [Serratia marcescens]
MSIKELADDALYLKNNGKYNSALSLMCLAIAGSSRLMYPSGTKSVSNKNDSMRDNEAFKICLNIMLSKVVLGCRDEIPQSPDITRFDFRGKESSLSAVLYEHYRCNLIHEASLPSYIHFVEEIEESKVNLTLNNCTFGTYRDEAYLSYEWIDFLYDGLALLFCNASEFGVEHYDLVLRDGSDKKSFIDQICSKFDVSFGRVEYFMHYLNIDKNYERDFNKVTSQQISAEFEELVREGVFTGVHRTPFRSQGIIDLEHQFTEKGMNLIKEMSGKFNKVKIA